MLFCWSTPLHQTLEVPADDELVMHLPIGDVMDDSIHIGDRISRVGASNRQYVRPESQYPHSRDQEY